MENKNVEAALNHYESHKNAMKRYVDSHREKIYKYNQMKYREMMEDSERHEKYKAKKRKNYQLQKERSDAK